MPDENVNESEETEDAQAVGEAEPQSVEPEAEAEVIDEHEAPEESDAESEAEPQAAEAEPAVEVEELAAESAGEPEPAEEPEVEPEPVVAEAEPSGEAAEPGVEPAAEVEDAAPVEPASAPASEVEAAPARKTKKKRLPRSLRPQRTKTKREKPAERKPITRLPKPEHSRGRRQERQGRVVSASADKTIVVRVDVAKVHPMYKKVIKRSTRFHAHDEENQAKVGDIVRIVETRPLSRMKRWRLQEIVEAAK
jgi:small subunit ribosomal protein S17